MSTNAAIIVKRADGKYVAVYTHWDGYPSHHAELLTGNYNSQVRAEALVALGWISILAPELAPPSGVQDFNNPDRNYCLAYHRDRDDEFRQHVGSTPAAACKTFWHSYRYLWDGNQWLVSTRGRGGFKNVPAERFKDADGDWHNGPVKK